MSGCNIPEPSKVPQAPKRGEQKNMNSDKEKEIDQLNDMIRELREERDAMEREMKHWYQLAKSYERTILKLVTALTREGDDVEE